MEYPESLPIPVSRRGRFLRELHLV